MKQLFIIVFASLLSLSVSNTSANEITTNSLSTSEYSVSCDASELAGLTEEQITKRGC